ncbi:MAG: SurA N-terminal domain-containing protein [Desulfobacteraceae bacterium]|nr:SurA N-terminal domain-containing protein [Desulfobacteraceae bacterium]
MNTATINNTNSPPGIPSAPSIGWMLALVFALLLSACTENVEQGEGAVLLSVGNRSVSVGQFREALAMAKSVYPPASIRSPEHHMALCRRVLRETIETVILEATAEDLGIRVTDKELHDAVSEIEGDYPDEEFERMLMENAVSYTLWKDRLRQRLLMNKVIDAVLGPPSEVTAEELTAWLRAQPDLVDEFPLSGEASGDAGDLLIGMVREEKRALRYRKWLEEEMKRRRIEVDPSRWQSIVGKSGG